MFHRILIALDGSCLAECAVKPAIEMARQFGSEVILLRVVGAAGQAGLPIEAEFDREEARDYLRSLEAQFLNAGVKVQTEVTSGEPAAAIVRLAEDRKVDLIVMSTHGRSGIMRLLYGSVAEAVLRGARTPLMLIPIKVYPAVG